MIPLSRKNDKNEIYKIQLSGVRDSLLSASSSFNDVSDKKSEGQAAVFLVDVIDNKL